MYDVGTDIQRGQSHLELSWDQLETKLRAIRLWEPSRDVSCFAGKRLLSEEMAFSSFQWMWPPAAVMNSLLIESCPFRALHTIFMWILMGYARVQLPREHFWASTGTQEYAGIVVQNRSPWCFKVYHVAMSLQLTVLQVPTQRQRHLVNLNQRQRPTVNSKPAMAWLFLEPRLDSVQTQHSQPSRSSDLVVQVSSSLFISRQNVLLHLYLARQQGV